jgi:general secretion pathway protein C
MQTDAYRLWSTRIVTFVMSALAAASAAYWGLKAWQPEKSSLAPTVVTAQASPLSPLAVAQALGGGVAPAQAVVQATPVVSHYALVGVMAVRFPSGGAALISVDGSEAKPVRVGNLVNEGMVLLSVTGRSAVLASTNENPQKFTLELPPLPN